MKLNNQISIEKASPDSLDILLDMIIELWPECDREEERTHFGGILNDEDKVVFLVNWNDCSIGFIYLAQRIDYVEGTSTSPVAYIEGIYTKPEHRRRGVTQYLIKEAEEWARSKGCLEMASDTEISNLVSIAFHHRSGFEEVNRIVCFRKNIG